MASEETMREIENDLRHLEEQDDEYDRRKRGVCMFCGLEGEDCFCDVED